jgi:hypothetical protein
MGEKTIFLKPPPEGHLKDTLRLVDAISTCFMAKVYKIRKNVEIFAEPFRISGKHLPGASDQPQYSRSGHK